MSRAAWIAVIIAVLVAFSWLLERLVNWLGDQGTWGHVVIWIILAGLLASFVRSFRKPADTQPDA